MDVRQENARARRMERELGYDADDCRMDHRAELARYL